VCSTPCGSLASPNGWVEVSGDTFGVGRQGSPETSTGGPGLELSVTGACSRVAEQLGIKRDTLRVWVKRAQIDAGIKPGLWSDQYWRLKERPREQSRVVSGLPVITSHGFTDSIEVSM
jgi:hypothetical protein